MEIAHIIECGDFSYMQALFIIVLILLGADAWVNEKNLVHIRIPINSKKWEAVLKFIIFLILSCFFWFEYSTNNTINYFVNIVSVFITIVCGLIVTIEVITRIANKPLTDSLSYKEFDTVRFLVVYYVLFINRLIENGITTIIAWYKQNISQYDDWFIIAIFISFYTFVYFIVLSNSMIAGRRLLESYKLRRMKLSAVTKAKTKTVAFEEDEDFKVLKKLGKFRISKVHLYCYALFVDVILYIIGIVLKIMVILKILLIGILGILKRIVAGFGNKILEKTDVELFNLSMYYSLIISVLTSYFIISQNNIINKISLDQYSFLTSVIIIPLVIIKISNLKIKKMSFESYQDHDEK